MLHNCSFDDKSIDPSQVLAKQFSVVDFTHFETAKLHNVYFQVFPVQSWLICLRFRTALQQNKFNV